MDVQTCMEEKINSIQLKKNYSKHNYNIFLLEQTALRIFFLMHFFLLHYKNYKNFFAAILGDIRLPKLWHRCANICYMLLFFFTFFTFSNVHSESCFHNLLNDLERIMCVRIQKKNFKVIKWASKRMSNEFSPNCSWFTASEI